MSKCLNCGFEGLSDKQLKTNLFNNVVNIHKNISWWEQQPYEIIDWLKDIKGLSPKVILDAGCGDGRWIPAILDRWQGIDYTGIDLYEEHIKDCSSKWPIIRFYWGDFLKNTFARESFNLILFGGVFNPIMSKERQIKIINEAKSLYPENIVITFDFNCSGHPPSEYMKPEYQELDSISVSKENEDKKQHVVALLYGRK